MIKSSCIETNGSCIVPNIYELFFFPRSLPPALIKTIINIFFFGFNVVAMESSDHCKLTPIVLFVKARIRELEDALDGERDGRVRVSRHQFVTTFQYKQTNKQTKST